MEIKQFSKSGLDYLLSGWNYLDFLPPMILIAFFIIELVGGFDYTRVEILDENGKPTGNFDRILHN
jgi:hypothetical protein